MSDQESQASRFARDMAANTEKMFKATQLIANTRDEDVSIGTTPKHLVMRRDKVELFHYEPMAAATAKTPVLLAYGLIGRYTMADLQPDRSLVRSLLSQMDVPARGAYVMSVVTPAERPAAASFTAVPRSLASSLSPSLTGAMFAVGAMAAPLLLCGVLKSVYDVALLVMFRKVRPRD